MLTSRWMLAGCTTLLATALALGQDGFKGKTLENAQFQKQVFKKGTSFSEATLAKCNFSEAKLVDADFRNATITSGYFLWADLTGADFRGAKLQKDVSFGAAILDNANLDGLDLSECGFNVTKFRGANLSNLKGINAASRCDFTGANLRGADLSGMRWPGVDAQPKFTQATYDKNTIWPALIDPTTVGAKLVAPLGKPMPSTPGSTPAEPKGDEPAGKELSLPGTYWQLLSLTERGEKITDASNPADVEFTKEGKWGILHYGGMREAGTFRVQRDRIVMTGEDGALYLDGKMTWKADSKVLELDTGKYLMRLRKITPKAPK